MQGQELGTKKYGPARESMDFEFIAINISATPNLYLFTCAMGIIPGLLLHRVIVEKTTNKCALKMVPEKHSPTR